MVWQVGVGGGGLYGMQEIDISQLVHISKACGEKNPETVGVDLTWQCIEQLQLLTQLLFWV